MFFLFIYLFVLLFEQYMWCHRVRGVTSLTASAQTISLFSNPENLFNSNYELIHFVYKNKENNEIDSFRFRSFVDHCRLFPNVWTLMR